MTHDTTRHDTTRHDTTRHDTTRHDTTRHDELASSEKNQEAFSASDNLLSSSSSLNKNQENNNKNTLSENALQKKNPQTAQHPLHNLLTQLCPNGVEVKTLGEVCLLKSGFGFSQKNQGNTTGDIPFIKVSDMNLPENTIHIVNSQNWISSTQQKVLKVKKFPKYSTVFAKVGAALLLNKRRILSRDTVIDNNMMAAIPTPSCNHKYLFYFLSQIDFKFFVREGAVPSINPRDLSAYSIPLPPLAIQKKIVDILDQFFTLEAQLEAQLEAELKARTKQYHYYRNALLNFEKDTITRHPLHHLLTQLCPNGVEVKGLKDICIKISSGGTPTSTNKDFYNGSIPWLRTQEVDYNLITSTDIKITEVGLKNSSAKWIPQNCVIIAMYGATAAKVAINAIPLTTNQACCNLEINPQKALFRYVFHWISCNYENLKALGDGTQSNLNAQKIKNFPIPLPPLAIQEEIVSILDRFDALVSDISIGLPAEITARKKQYHYYRDSLLNFETYQRE